MQMVSQNKQKKIEIVSKMSDVYNSDGNWLFLINYSGMKADANSKLRSSVRKFGGSVFVVKNKLNSIAFSNSGFESLKGHLKGQTAIISSKDVIAVSKILKEHEDGGSVSIIACSNGPSVYDADKIKKVAGMPPIEVLRSQLLGILLSVPTKLVSTLVEPHRSLLRVLEAKSSQKQDI